MGRSPCCEREHTNRGAWTKEEDERLINYIKLHGEGCWRSLPKAAGLLRCGKSCRLRWINYLRPDLKRGNFTEQEDELIINLHSLLGNKWSSIATRLAGRTDNEIKNYWNTHIKRKLYSRGIDPQTHRPLDNTTGTPPTNTSTSSVPLDIVSRKTNNHTFDLVTTTNLAVSSCTNTNPAGEDSNSNSTSGVTTGQLNLELSIGLPSQSQVPLKRHQQKQHQQVLYQWYGNPCQGVCLCCSLGFQTTTCS